MEGSDDRKFGALHDLDFLFNIYSTISLPLASFSFLDILLLLFLSIQLLYFLHSSSPFRPLVLQD